MIWKSIAGYEGYYEISDIGSVRSVDRVISNSNRTQRLKGRLKAFKVDRDGYLKVALSKDGISKTYAVHRLVYETFVGEIPDGYEINHINCVRDDNRPANLECVTHSDNIKHTIKNGRHITQTRDMKGANNPNFGNRKLSELYSRNKGLCKEKQGRRGSQNGRSIKVLLVTESPILFDTIKECSIYLIASGFVKDVSQEWLSSQISKALRGGVKCYGLTIIPA